CRLVFEAALENEEAKQEIFRTLNGICAKECYYLSNTSSLPIGGLEETCGMKGRLMGFHFYNPPPVQKLVEVITTEHTLKDLVHLSEELGKRLRKILIPSRDIAGFIGNGHFMRDLLYACEQAKKLAKQHGVAEGIMMMQRVTQDFLLRPMGIFQLADYVGLDVCRNILAIMDTHSEESLRSPLIERMLQQGIRGGQLPDGSQKDGFLRYEGKRITGVYDPDRGGYVEWESMEAKVNERLGPLPASHQSWKELLASKERATLLQSYFAQLWEMDSLGADLARQYLQKSRSIALQLREEGVAHAIDDVNAVMEYGFYHLYGPVSDLIPQTQLSKTESI
ncbi:MAG: 3-hydroxyacyl-CoA dehydrogenase family protein, partial [Chlamydiia bacterium]|nr:3-hydroxyacyl-CoA dehydrogenase family protein [Chlamydiia bacterium]